MVNNRDCKRKSIEIGSMSSEREKTRLRDIVENADRVADYLDRVDPTRFMSDHMRADAIERCLQRITEAVIQLGPEHSDQAGLNLAWQDVRSLGNRLRHEYRYIDRRVIYDLATNAVPELREAAARALEAK